MKWSAYWKNQNYGGSKIRPEATGYGVTYFIQEMLKDMGESIEGKTVAISGYGNVAWGAAKKNGRAWSKGSYYFWF